MKKSWSGLMLFALLCGSLTVHGETLSGYRQNTPADYQLNNKIYNNLPGSLQTPCIRWADPFALGKLKILIILPAYAAREGIELQERLSSEVTMITTLGKKEWGAATPDFYTPVPVGEEVTSLARIKLGPSCRYDVIVIGKIQWTIIPEKIRQLVLGKVRGGAGLVIVGPRDVEAVVTNALAPVGTTTEAMEQIKQAVPLGSLPLDMDMEPLFPKAYPPRRIGPLEIREGKLGEGVVIALDYKDTTCKNGARIDEGGGPWQDSIGQGYIALTPYLQDDPLFYDYYYSILAKVLLYAGRKDPGVRVASEAQAKTVERGKLPGAVVSFKVTSSRAEENECQFYYEIRDRQNRVAQSGEKTVMVGKDGAGFSPDIPALKQGLYMADLWVKQGGKVLGWASAAFTVTDIAYIEGVKADKEYFQREEGIAGTVKFKTQPDKGKNASVELWDTYDRLVQSVTPAKDGRFVFQKISNPLSRTYKILAQVKEKGMVLDEAETWVGLPSSVIDEVQFIMWGGGGLNQRVSKIAMYQMKRYGGTGCYPCIIWSGEDSLRFIAHNLARNNVVANPYATTIMEFCIGEKFEYPKCCYTTLENSIAVQAADHTRKVDVFKQYGMMGYVICEEGYIGKAEDHWTNPAAMKDYHAYLKERYGDLKRLNEIWGSSFKDFAEIAKISFMEAKTGGQYSRWFEQERHKVDRFALLNEATVKTIRERDPNARVSLDCIGGMDYDWPRMSKVIRATTQSPLEKFNKGDGSVVGTFTGFYAGNINEYVMRVPPWQYIFQGGTHMVWWGAWLTPDFSEPLLAFKQCSEEMQELESGAGKLLMSSRKRIDPIRLLWSSESYFAGILNPQDITWEDSINRFDNLFRRIGLDYKAVGSEYAENQLTFGDDCHVLVLPNCQSLSQKQAERIRTFVKAGGVVLADFMPGTMDEYLRPYGQKAAAGGAVSSEPCTTCKEKGRIEDGNVWRTCPKCGGTGKIIKGGGIAAKSILEDVFDFSQKGMKACGKGYGVFFKGFPDKKEEWGGIRKLLAEKGGVKSDVEILDKLENLRTDVRWYLFDNGRVRFLGILPDLMIAEPPGQEITLRLKEKAHVYDVRANRYLGFFDQAKVGIEPVNAKLLAFYPERIEGIKMSAAKKKYSPGETVELKINIQPKSLKDSVSVVRVEVRKGDKIVECFTKNFAFQGEGIYAIPLALNQEKGEYTVHGREMVAGYTADASFAVK